METTMEAVYEFIDHERNALTAQHIRDTGGRGELFNTAHADLPHVLVAAAFLQDESGGDMDADEMECFGYVRYTAQQVLNQIAALPDIELLTSGRAATVLDWFARDSLETLTDALEDAGYTCIDGDWMLLPHPALFETVEI